MTEQILVILRADLGAFLDFQGFKPVADEPLHEWVSQSRFEPRPAMEDDPSFQQWIPYILLRKDENVFRYCRTKKGGESRLHDLYSIGIGGHINPIDRDGSTISSSILEEAAFRELDEEMHIDQPFALKHIGYINDDESDVGKVHLGLVYEAWLDEGMASTKEDALSKGEWKRILELNDGAEYETWSQFIIDQYLLQQS